jgi:hypothetical protein
MEPILFPPEDEDDFLVVATPGDNGCYCEFACYEQAATSTPEQPTYLRKGYTSSDDGVADYREAQPFLEGSIRFDGCSNLYFPDDCYHFCGRRSAARVGQLLDLLYDLAEGLIPEWSGREAQR